MENVVYDPGDPDPAQRYKGLGHCFGREPIVSPDGITWKRLDVPKIPASDESNLSLDQESRTFIATVKHGGPHGRSVFLSTSADFRSWTKPELIFHADDQDQVLGREWIEHWSSCVFSSNGWIPERPVVHVGFLGGCVFHVLSETAFLWSAPRYSPSF